MALQLAFAPEVHASPPCTTAGFLVLDQGGRHATVLTGEPLAPTGAMDLRGKTAGKVQLSPDGDVAYIAFTDGWVASYSLTEMRMTAEYQVGNGIDAMAQSHDGKWLAVATESPPALVILDSHLRRTARHASANLNGELTSRISSIETAGQRRSFIIAQRDIAELWEVSYDPQAEPIHDGMVHDYRMGEAIAKPGFFGIRRTPLDRPLDVFLYDLPHRHALGIKHQQQTSRSSETAPTAEVINLDIRRRIAWVPLNMARPPESGATFKSAGQTLMAITAQEGRLIQIIDTQSWKTIWGIDAPGAGNRVKTHANTRYLWVDWGSASRDDPIRGITLIGKVSLRVEATLHDPKWSLGPTAFSTDGKVIAAIGRGQAGALLVYVTDTLLQTQHVPLDDPIAVFSLTTQCDLGR